MKILGIVGSPRIGGNTETLVDEVLAGAKEAGASIEKVILNKLKINPCQACNSCRKTGNCMHKDDMVDLLDKMVENDGWILGTPIYWWGPTAQFKAFLDRWYHPRHREFKGKHVIIVIPFGGGHEKYARHTVGMLEDGLEYLGINVVETLLAPGFGRRSSAQNNTKMLTRARDAGKVSLVNLISQ